MATPLDELLDTPDSEQVAQQLSQVVPAGETPAAANRVKAADLASRGIPSFTDAYGDVSPVTDETGAALTHLDKSHGIAYDSAGQPKSVSYDDEFGPPTVKDPFAGIPATTDPKTGNQYQEVKGLPWKWVGVDQAVAGQRLQEQKDKALKAESALVGQKLTLDHADLVTAGQEVKGLKKQLTDPLGGVPELSSPKYQGADLETVKKGIDEHFNTLYAAPEANATAGWFGDQLTPEAAALRAKLDQRKALVHETADRMFAAGAKINELSGAVESARAERRAATETLLAHQRGQEGPLDPGYQQAEFEQQQRQDLPRTIEEMKALTPDAVRTAAENGDIPPQASAASVAASHDAHDALAKADKLQASNPSLADQFRAVGEGILSGLTTGLGELAKSPLGQGVRGIIDLATFGKTGMRPEQEQQLFGDRVKNLAPQVDEKLKDTVGAKIGEFTGGMAPYALAAVASGPASPAVLGSLFFSSGYQSTRDDALAHKATPQQADAAGLVNGAINAALAVPLGVVGKAYEAMFGSTAPKVIKQAIVGAFEKGGAEAVGNIFKDLQGYIAGNVKPVIGGVAQDVKAQTLEAMEAIRKEMGKSVADRAATVAKTAAQHAAIGAGVQTAQNLVSKTYDPERGAFEGAGTQAIGFGALGFLSEGFRQVAKARNVKAALDVINRKGEPPPGTALTEGPEPTGPPPPNGTQKTPTGTVTYESNRPTEKVVTGKDVTPTSPSDTKGGDKNGVQKGQLAPKSVDKEVESTRTPETEKETGQRSEVLAPNPKPEAMARKDIASELGAMGYTVEDDGTLSKQGETVKPHEARAIQLHEELQGRATDEGAHEAATSTQNDLAEPTQAQKEAGNYKVGPVKVGGLDISIENPAGSKRKPEWSPLQSHYGYIKGTVGADKDHVDIFVKQGTPTNWSGPVFVVNQKNAAGNFDEHKAVIGVANKSEAAKEYLSNYEPGWKGLQNVVEFPDPQAFKRWAESGDKGPAQPEPLSTRHIITDKNGQQHHVVDFGRKGSEAEGKVILRDAETGKESAMPLSLAEKLPRTVAGIKGTATEGGRIDKLGGGLSYEQTNLRKLATGVLNQHKDVLKHFGNDVIREGSTTNDSGIQETDGKIHFDWSKIEKATKDLTPRQRTKFIQRGVEEGIIHLHAIAWAKESPANRTRLKAWGAEKDELDRHLSGAYGGWEKLSDEQKAHEKLRAVLQQRWTGKLTEAAYRVLREFLKYLRGIWEKLTPDQRAIVSEVEARMGRETAPTEKPTPESELGKPRPEAEADFITEEYKGKGGATKVRVIDGIQLFERRSHRQQLEKRIADLGDKMPATTRQLLRTLLQSGPRKEPSVSALQQAERKIAALEKPEPEATGAELLAQLKKKAAAQGRVVDDRLLTQIKELERQLAADAADHEHAQKIKAEAEKPATASTLDEATQKKTRDLFEGLSAALPVQSIKAPAIRLKDGTIVNVPAGQINWHASAVDASIEKYGAIATKDFEKGYITTNGHFLTKDQAYKLARIGSSTDLEDAQRFAVGAADPLIGAPVAPIPQKALPVDKLGAFVSLAQDYIRQGIDTPEKLARELDALLPSKGRGYAQAMWDLIGTVDPSKRGTHDWRTKFAPVPQKEEEKPKPPAEPKVEDLKAAAKDPRPFGEQAISVSVKGDLLKGRSVPRKILNGYAEEAGVEQKAADEAAEVGVVQAARQIIKESTGKPEGIFDRLVKLYNDQPNLTAKTSTSKVAQAYSTPIPLAYAASRLADVKGGKSIYEPTAGNGALLIEADPNTQRVNANEYNTKRFAYLRSQFPRTSPFDAAEWAPGPAEGIDRIVENPPFGTVIDDKGQTKKWAMWDSETSQIDHAIVAKSLETLKDDGRAVLIIGGKNITDPEQRAQAYAQGGKFYKELYARYRVVDHFTIDGDLYSKQGAGWPVDVIVIAGRGKSPIELPSANAPRILSSWEQLKNELTRTDAERIKAGAFDEGKARSEASGVFDDIRTAIRPVAGTGGETGVQPPATTNESGGLPARGELTDGELSKPVSGSKGSVEPTGGRAGGIPALESSDEPVQRGTIDLESFRTPYKPVSKAESFGIYIPTNMDSPVHDALGKLKSAVGDIDEYVIKNLGYTPPKNAFSAEQIDALALAIHAVEKGTAFVLGDQGGVGKGRVAAGMIVYAIRKGHIPVFMTKDVKLYAAMLGDFADIGRPDLQPVFTDRDITFEDEKDKVWRTGNTIPLMEQIAATGKLPPDKHVFFTTYYQIQNDVPRGFKSSKAESAARKAAKEPPPDGPRMDALNKIAPNAVFIMDESHLAAGDSIRAWRIAPLLEKAPAAYYSSATFAKRPESMGIYSRTTLSHAAGNMDELVEAMTLGGAPLQQAVSAMLAEDGLYMRRERDFSGTVFNVHINKETSERDRSVADNYTAGLRKIVTISNTMEAATKRLNKLMKRNGKKYNVTAVPRLEATNFSEKLHILVSQYLFAIKAESTAQNAIRAIKDGLVGADGVKRKHRVVITMQNTMEAGIQDLRHSGRELSFKGMLLSYLDTMRELGTGRRAFGRGEQEKMYISDTPDPELARYSDRELERQLFTTTTDEEGNRVGVLNEPVAKELFRRIISAVIRQTAAEIEEMELADMPLSPIDYIRQQLTKAGIKSVEMTGRSVGIDPDGKVYERPASARSKKAHLRAMGEFNNGDAEAMLMNASGSTGISMQSSYKFKNQDPRAMIVVQPHLDINEFMQTLWRIDRTGQVHKPHYIILQTTIPAEIRIASVMMMKMALLNANTTSNSENEMKKGVDLVNQYGDEVVYAYLQSDPGFVTLLQWPAIADKQESHVEGEPDRYVLKDRADIALIEPGKLVAGVTGHMAILPVSEQEEFYAKVLPDYDTLINYLNALGQNELVAQTIDMKAETLSRKVLTSGRMASKEGEATHTAPEPSTLESVFDAPSHLERVRAEVGKKPREAEEVLAKANEVENGARAVYLKYMTDSQAWIDKNAEGKAETWPERMRAAREVIANSLSLLGQTVHLTNPRGLDAFGAVVDVHFDEDHLLTPSKQTFTVWVNTTQRTLRLAATQLSADAKRTPSEDFVAAYRGSEERSNERYIVTGNLLAASVAIRDTAPGAKIVQYTNDKGEVRQGILMPAKFSPEQMVGKVPVESSSHLRQLLDAGRGIANGDESAQLTQAPRGGYLLRVKSSKATGGTFWRDPQLQAMMEGGEFAQRASAMVGNFTAEKLPQVFDRLQSLGGTLYFAKTIDNEDASLGAAAPTAVFKDYWQKDVAAKLANANAGFHEILDALVHVVSPTYGVNKDAVDQVHKLLGDRNQVNYIIDRAVDAMEKAFNKMPRLDQVAFIDRMKTGVPQPSPELQKVADTLRKIDTDSWQAAEAEYKRAGYKESPLKWLDNHYRVLWKKIPGSPTDQRWTPGQGKRPLAGTKGMMKQHTLEDMSEGLDAGGIPVSYNPITMFKLAQADIWKLTTALKMWNWGKENGFVSFVRGPFPKVPEGMTWINDSISRVYFPAASGEGLIEPGRYAVEEGFGRILNNYLSRDFIRATQSGRSLLWLKNFTTSLELALSVFHGVFETLEAIGSNIGLGLSKIANKGGPENKRDFFGGMMDIIKSFHSPISGYSLGKTIRKAAGSPDTFFATAEGKELLKTYPRAREMINDLFSGGWKPTELEADWKNKSIQTFIDAVSDLRAGTSSNYIGAGLRAFPAANEFLMKPLFDYYIPNLKLAQFFREYDEALRSNERKLKGGILTRAALARQVWRFVEGRFGELNYDTLFWNNTFKSAMQLMFRSVTWKLGSVESFSKAFSGQAKEFMDAARERRAPELHRNMAWLFGMFLLTAAIGAILSKTLGNKEPKNLTDYVFPQIDPSDPHVRVSIPTYFKDLVHLIHSPFGYVKSSMAGWIGRVADLLSNKDYYGVQIRNTDDPLVKQALQVGRYATETMLPFSIRGYRNLSDQQVNALRKSLSIVGVNPAPRYIGQSAAEQRVDEIMHGKRSEGGITPEQFEQSRAKRALVAELRHGKPADISGALTKGTLKPRDVAPLYKRAQMGQLASSINYMTLPEAESVYKRASAAEKAELAGILQRKRQGSAARAGTAGKTLFTGF